MGASARDLTRRRRAHALLLEEAVESVRRRLAGAEGVRRVSVFGSYARGRRDLFTDLDVLVVMDSDASFPERLADLYGRLALPVDVDIVCYTPEEFESMKDRAFLRRALQEEVILYEAEPG